MLSLRMTRWEWVPSETAWLYRNIYSQKPHATMSKGRLWSLHSLLIILKAVCLVFKSSFQDGLRPHETLCCTKHSYLTLSFFVGEKSCFLSTFPLWLILYDMQLSNRLLWVSSSFQTLGHVAFFASTYGITIPIKSLQLFLHGVQRMIRSCAVHLH